MIPASVLPLIDQLLTRCHFPAGKPLACAVSGGADSCALLVLATQADCEVTAHHVDHGIRPDSAHEAAHVAEIARRFGARFVGHRVRVDPGPNLEARARAARYAVLPADIVTGHTLDDQAETMLINLLRGAARGGLSPMGAIERHPLIDLRRSDTAALCAALDIEIVVDPSNADPAFLRNRIRHQVLPLLDEVAGRDLAPVLARQADLFAAEDELLDELARCIDATDARAVATAHRALARRAVRNWITTSWQRGHPPSADSVERVLAVAAGTATACEIEGGHRVQRTKQRLTVVSPDVV